MPSNSQFPSATKTFSIYRRNQTTQVGNNLVPASNSLIDTGWAIALKDMQDSIIVDKDAGSAFTGVYIGTSFNDIPTIIGDILWDETENDRFGNPVRYSIQGQTVYAICTKLHLKQLQIGI